MYVRWHNCNDSLGVCVTGFSGQFCDKLTMWPSVTALAVCPFTHLCLNATTTNNTIIVLVQQQHQSCAMYVRWHNWDDSLVVCVTGLCMTKVTVWSAWVLFGGKTQRWFIECVVVCGGPCVEGWWCCLMNGSQRTMPSLHWTHASVGAFLQIVLMCLWKYESQWRC